MLLLGVKTTEDGYLCIENLPECGEMLEIFVHPEQLETLIRWLREAAAELETAECEDGSKPAEN